MHAIESAFLNCMIEYLSKIQTKFENTQACVSGTGFGSNNEKNGSQKSCDTLPLSISYKFLKEFGTFYG